MRNFESTIMPLMMLQNFKFVDSSKTQKSKCLESKTLFLKSFSFGKNSSLVEFIFKIGNS